MNVKKWTFCFENFIIFTIIFLVFPTNGLEKCKRGILNNYGLVGRYYASNYPMKICTHIINNCCSLQDEIKIVSLWNYHTKPILDRHTSYCIDAIKSIVDYFYPLSALNPELIVMKKVTRKTTQYKHQRCKRVIKKMTRIQEAHFLEYVDKTGEFIRDNTIRDVDGQRHWGIMTDLTNPNSIEQLNHMKKQRREQYFLEVQKKRDEKLKKRKGKGRKLTDDGVDAPKDKELKNQRNLSEIWESKESRPNLLLINELIKLNQPIIERNGHKLTHEIVSQFIDVEGKQLSHKNVEMICDQLKIRPERNEGFSKLEGRILSSKKKGKGRRKANKKPTKKRSRAPKNARTSINNFLSVPKPSLISLECRGLDSTYVRDYITINPRKVEFCYRIYTDFLHYNIGFFNDTLVEVKKNMMGFAGLRKQFFCSLCDGTGQNYFDAEKKVMIYKQEFCSDVIHNYLDYLQFMNILLIEFSDSLLQYVQCYETDAEIYNFPYQNFLVKYKRRIHFFRKCFNSVLSGDPAFMKNCWFICNKFSYLRISSIFDGDLPLLSRIKIAIFSFLRKFSQQSTVDETLQNNYFVAKNVSNIDLGIVENVDGILIEPVSPGLLISNRRFVLNENEREGLLGKYSINGIPQINPNEWQKVNDFLASVNLFTIDNLLAQHKIKFESLRNETQAERIKNNPTDQSLQEVSQVNGMVNQLYSLMNRQNISDHMLPRKMKQDAIKIIRDYGFKPISLDRRLDDMELFPVMKTIDYSHSPLNETVYHPNVTTVDGKRKKIVDESKTLESDIKFKIESPAEIYEKLDKTIDMYDFGISFEMSGMNPVAFYYFADFERNITNIVNDHFVPKEKFDGDVLREYILYNKTKINQFNELFDADIMDFDVIKSRDNMYNKYKKISSYAYVNDRYKLQKVAEEGAKSINQKTKEIEGKKRRDRERLKLILKYAKAQELDKLTSSEISKQLTSNLPGFNETFNGMSSFFLNMFGN
jgi:hypothetical protein